MNSLHTRLITTMLIVLLSGLTVIGTLFYQYASNSMMDHRRAYLELQARNLAQDSLDSLWSEDASWLDNKLASLYQSDRDYAYIAIVYPSGEILTHSELDKKPQKMLTISYMADGLHRQGRYLGRDINEFIYPVFHKNKLLANVHLAYYADTRSFVSSQTIWQVILVAIACLLLLAFISYFIIRNFSRGVRQLTWSLGKVSLQEKSPVNPVLEKRTDEIGDLARACKKMTDDMISKYHEMAVHINNNKSIIDSFGDGIIIFDQHGTIESINVAAEHIFAYSQEELAGSHVVNLLPESERKKHQLYLQKHLQSRIKLISGAKLDIKGLRKDGSTIPLELVMGLICDSGKVLYAATVRDMTRRNEYEQALKMSKVAAEEGSRVKTEFLAMMSHELRTPMNAIMGMIDLLESDRLSEDQHQYVLMAKAASNELLGLLDNILDFPGLDNNYRELDIVEIDFRQMIVSLVDYYLPSITNKDVNLKGHVEVNVSSHYLGDATRIRKVLSHLLNNAIKFTETGDIGVNVSIAEHNKDTTTLRFEVTDTGIGIATQDYARIFDLFTQVDSSSTRIYGGIGIGLAICKRKVENMGGQIGVISNPGEGSTFWFQIVLQNVSKTLSHDRAEAIQT